MFYFTKRLYLLLLLIKYWMVCLSSNGSRIHTNGKQSCFTTKENMRNTQKSCAPIQKLMWWSKFQKSRVCSKKISLILTKFICYFFFKKGSASNGITTSIKNKIWESCMEVASNRSKCSNKDSIRAELKRNSVKYQ